MLKQSVLARVKLSRQRVDYPPGTKFNVYQYSTKTDQISLSDTQVPYKLAQFLAAPFPEFEDAGLYYWYEPCEGLA